MCIVMGTLTPGASLARVSTAITSFIHSSQRRSYGQDGPVRQDEFVKQPRAGSEVQHTQEGWYKPRCGHGQQVASTSKGHKVVCGGGAGQRWLSALVLW
jgi:hypothetical protein